MMTAMPDADGIMTDDDFREMMERASWVGAFPWDRWLINRRRVREGKPPFDATSATAP